MADYNINNQKGELKISITNIKENKKKFLNISTNVRKGIVLVPPTNIQRNLS
ncbi:MAG: hypothetical protein HeimC3_18490 [Candidatus Heimdallarchaeota archaeon LC_3]|nr:MAG: hypothetical protein HeimC3_18490 [Candidatus Heimdallarchaeota archaeon LC_3]